jgi:hypothetical protein
MSWSLSLPPELQTGILAGYISKITADLTMRLLDAVGKRAARRFGEEPHQVALRDALTQGLAVAIAQLRLPPDQREHYLDLFGKFMCREAVVAELSLVIDPRPNVPLDLDPLLCEFVAAGFDPDYLGPVNFNHVILFLVGAFYDAAAKNRELQGAIEINLLRQLAEDCGALRVLAGRTAAATERAAIATETLVDLAERLARGAENVPAAVETMRKMLSRAPGNYFDAYQETAAGLGRVGWNITIDRSGRVTIAIDPGPELTASIDLTPPRRAWIGASL